MPPPLDPSLFEALPADLRTAVEAQTEALAAERAARLHLDAEIADPRSRNAELAALNARLEHLAREMKRARFGARSEKLNPEQLELAFEDLEAAMAEAQEQHDTAAAARSQSRPIRKPPTPRALPKDLPREERVIEPESLACPCGCGAEVVLCMMLSTKLTERVSTTIPFIAAAIDRMSHQPLVGCTIDAPSVERADPEKATVCTIVAGAPVSKETSEGSAR